MKNILNSPDKMDSSPRGEATHKVITKKAFFLNLEELSNKEIVEKWLATGLIKDWESAKDVADKLSKYDPILGELMTNIIEQNEKQKRGGKKKNPYMTGKNPITNEDIRNPRDYLEIMSDYIIKKINSEDGKEWHQERQETIKSLFWIKQDTQRALIELFSWD